MAPASDGVNDPGGREAGFSRRAVIAAVLLTVATVLMIWLAAVPWGPIVCAAIWPPAPHCVRENRVGTATVVTAVVIVIGLATASAPILRRRGHRRLTQVGLVLLAVSLFVAYPVVAWSPGFPLAASDGQTAVADPGGTWAVAQPTDLPHEVTVATAG